MNTRNSVWKTALVLLGVVSVLTITSASWAITYFVDVKHGNDSNAGTARGSAFKTIQQAANIMGAGDTCTVLSGVYDERVHISKSARSGLPIAYKAEGSVTTHGFTIKADYIHLTGFQITNTVNEWENGAGIHLEGRYCLIENNYIHDVTRVGIQVFSDQPDSSSTSHCIVRNNTIKRAGLAGIEVYGRNNTIENNDISHILQYPPKWTDPPSWADADGIHFFGSGHIIRKNYIHNIHLSDKENIDPHIDAIQTFGPAYDILFEQNVFDMPDHQGAMIEQQVKPVGDLTFRNNIFKNSSNLNIWGMGSDMINVNVVNNSFLRVHSYAVELHDCVNVRVMNNVFYDCGDNTRPYLYTDEVTGLQAGYNCIYMSDGKPPKGSPWPNDLWQVDPRFRDVGRGNLRLRSDSPLIDAGADLSMVRNDFDGVSRPQGSGYDIGAFESHIDDGAPPSPPQNLMIVP